VIGAGPAGLHAAFLLAQAGLEVTLLEGQARVGDRAICSGVVGTEAFQRFSLPAHSVLSEIRAIQAISPGGKRLEHHADAPLALVLDKAEFNRALARRARGAGVEFRLGAWVKSLEAGKHSVTVCYRTAEGGTSKLRGQVAVIATGVNGALNASLGLARPGQFLHALQTELTLPPNGHGGPTRIFVGRGVAPGAFAWSIPLAPHRYRVGLMADENPGPFFVRLVRRLSPQTDVDSLRVDHKGIAQAATGPCVTDRVIAVGEAAGHVKTTTGGGIYYGLLSAELAAGVIQAAFARRNFTSRALGEFERYWRSAIGKELLVGYLARSVASRLSDGQIDRLFELANATNLLFHLNGRLKFDWHHRALLATMRALVLPGAGERQAQGTRPAGSRLPALLGLMPNA